MMTRLFRLTAVVLTAALCSCAASPATFRVAAAQVPSGQMQRHAPGAAACAVDDSGFDAPDAMKLPKDALGGCWPR